ncbi:hypothetical protein E1B28_002314 [Marasmius oreades]|nr:uncharacterized protein E1B28_002314 [Marasmius oreades]KAG7086353.1 hypothetical protein E1B28_002314 [Marasmius oreades]
MHVENPSDISKLSRLAAYYLMAITFYTVIWASRISIIFSIIRIDPNPSRRFIYIGVSIIYFIAVVVMIVQLFWVCEPMPGWKDAASPQCPLTKQVAICQLVTDILADMFLLFAPLRVFLHLQDKALRRKLIVIFSTCIVTTIVSLVHAAYILTTGGIRVIISALVEDCVSLIVANVPVVVTALLRHAGDHDHKPVPTKSFMSTAIHFASRKLKISRDGSKASHERTWSSSATLTNVGGAATSIGVVSHGVTGDDHYPPHGGRGRGATTTTGGVGVTSEPIMLDFMDQKGSANLTNGEEDEEIWRQNKSRGTPA